MRFTGVHYFHRDARRAYIMLGEGFDFKLFTDDISPHLFLFCSYNFTNISFMMFTKVIVKIYKIFYKMSTKSKNSVNCSKALLFVTLLNTL